MITKMDCSENENVCSVKKENNLGFYRLHTIWRDDGFFINITSKDGAWRGEMTPSLVKSISKELDMEPKAYLQQCKTALTTHDGQQGISYGIDNGSFTWKKLVDEDSGIKIKLGSIMLKPASFIDTIQNLVTVALDCNKKLEKQLKEVLKEKNALETNKNELSLKLDSLILSKNLMENDLYLKFLLLLNTKKEKIAELSTKINKSNKESDSENPYEMETDEDAYTHEEEKTKIKSQRLKKANKRRRSPLMRESLKQEKEANVEHESLLGSSCLESSESNESVTLSQKDPQKSQIPSTKDELLEFFYNS